MAVDKLVDSTQLNADLTSVANAIRTRGGTSAQLAFPSGFIAAVQAIPSGTTPTGTKNISINANGTTTEDVTNYASASISVNVPNSYSASDEGKVVSNGALVGQTSDTVTENDTYDTTLINSLTVNVPSGGEVTSYVVDKAGSGSNSISLDIPFTPSAIIYFELDPMTAGSFVSTTHRVMGIYVSDYPRQLYANQGNTTRGGYLSATSSTTHSYSNGVFTVGGSAVVLLSTRTYRFIAVK